MTPIFVSESQFVLAEHVVAFRVRNVGKRYALEAVTLFGVPLGVGEYGSIDDALSDLNRLFFDLEPEAV